MTSCVLHYQPKLRLENRPITGVEALVRWHAPRAGTAAARRVRPARGADGADQAADELRPATALDRSRAWHETGHDLSIAVNVSERSLLDPSFRLEVGALLAESGVPPYKLEIEITEGAIMADPARAAAVLRGLDSLGVTLSLDDFGTGYSSLSRLRDLPISEIKIDRSFAARIDVDERDVAILRTAIELGHNLGCSVVAEGLETASALEPRHVTRLRHRPGIPHRPAARRRQADGMAGRPHAGQRARRRSERRSRHHTAALNRGSARTVR